MEEAQRARVKEIWIKNFKSLKDVRTELGDFNLLIGPNRAGKTSFLEALKLLRAIYYPGPGEEVNPFLPWWSYDRVVWRRDERLPIAIGMALDILGYDVEFETTFTGIGGAFNILREVVDIKGAVRIEKRGGELRVSHDMDFLETAWGVIGPIWEELWRRPLVRIPTLSLEKIVKKGKEGLVNYTTSVSVERPILSLLSAMMPADLWWEPKRVGVFILEPDAVIISPVIPIELEEPRPFSLIERAVGSVAALVKHILLLVPVETRRIREALVKPAKETELSENALNLHNVLCNLWMRNGGRLPERIEAAIRDVFGPEVRITFTLTEDGRIYMRAFEGDLKLDPPMISDGFYKVLAILTAIETRPSILAIDELENSLHLEAIERLLDELRNAGCTVIAATHSPLVIDLAKPEEIIFMDRDEEGATVVKRVEDPEVLKRRLAERGITLSEGWLYGQIP